MNKYAKQAQAAPVSRRPARVLCGSDSIAGNRRAGYAEHLGEVPARHARPHQRDRPDPQRRAAVAPRSARLPLVRCVPLVEPLVESLPRGVPRLAGRVHDGHSAFLDHLDGLALFLCRVARHLRTPNRTGSVQLFVRTPPSQQSSNAFIQLHKASNRLSADSFVKPFAKRYTLSLGSVPLGRTSTRDPFESLHSSTLLGGSV